MRGELGVGEHRRPYPEGLPGAKRHVYNEGHRSPQKSMIELD